MADADRRSLGTRLSARQRFVDAAALVTLLYLAAAVPLWLVRVDWLGETAATRMLERVLLAPTSFVWGVSELALLVNALLIGILFATTRWLLFQAGWRSGT